MNGVRAALPQARCRGSPGGCAGRGLRPVTRVRGRGGGGDVKLVSPPPYLGGVWVPPSDLNSRGGGGGRRAAANVLLRV